MNRGFKKPLGLTALAALAAVGCYSTTIDGTSLLVRVSVPLGLEIDQLRFSASGPEGSVLPQTLRPNPAAGQLSADQSVRILLDTALQGQRLTVDVEGLSAGAAVASAENQTSPPIAPGAEVTMSVDLQPGAPDAGSDAGALCAAGAKVAGPLCTGAWCWEFPLPAANALYGVWTSQDCQVFAVGAAGTVLHKAADTWTASYGGVLAQLEGVWGSSPTNVWAVGDCGAIMHWDGHVWSAAVQSNCAAGAAHILWTSVDGTSADDVWTAGVNGAGQGIVAQWNGQSWGAPQVLNGAPELTSIWFSGPSDGWAVGVGGAIWHYNGQGWQGVGSPTTDLLLGVFGFDAGDAWSVGYDAGTGQAILIRLEGQTWVTPPQPPPAELAVPLYSLWGTSDADLVTVGGAGTTGLASFLSGGQWTVEPGAPLRAVTGAPDGTTWAAGSSGALYRGNIGSLGQQELPLQVDPSKPATLYAVTQSGTEAWAAGSSGTVLRYETDAGWKSYPPPNSTYIVYSLWQAGPGNLWAAGQSGFLVHSSGDGGWDTPIIRAPSSYPSWVGMSGDVSSTGALELWLVGGAFNLTRVTGASVAQCPIDVGDSGVDGGSLRLYAVWSSDGGVVAVGQGGLIVSNTDTDGGCQLASYGGHDLHAIWGPSADDLWAVGSAATILHGSLAGGWTLIPPPTGVTQNFLAVTGDVKGGDATRIWVSGTGGGAYAYLVDGGVWGTQELLGNANDALSATSSGNGDVRFVGAGTTVVHRGP